MSRQASNTLLIVLVVMALLAGTACGPRAQQAVIRGTVRSDSGALLADVDISVRGMAFTTTTGEDGRYTITVSDARVLDPVVTLRFRRLGYQPLVRVLTVRSGAQVVDVTLEAGETVLEGLVVVSTRDELPQFPWPPPRATARFVVPRGLVTGSVGTRGGRTTDTLGYVADSIERALDRAGIERAVYAIGDSGFAYVTRAERIHRTGRAFAPPERFPNDIETATGGHGFLDFIVSRFRARPGFFRIIAIVVTSRPVTASRSSIPADSAGALVHGGMATLPSVLRNRAVSDLRAVALVFEYERPSSGDSVELRQSPLVGAREHLAAAGLWASNRLGGMR